MVAIYEQRAIRNTAVICFACTIGVDLRKTRTHHQHQLARRRLRTTLPVSRCPNHRARLSDTAIADQTSGGTLTQSWLKTLRNINALPSRHIRQFDRHNL